MSDNHLKAKRQPERKTADVGAGAGKIGDARHPHFTTNRRRCLPPQEGALARLDSVEQRLQAARAAGDDDRWSRLYLAWLKLHNLAFDGYGAGVSAFDEKGA